MCRHHKNLDWQKYIDDQGVDRREYELALAKCPSCFQEYLHLLQGSLEQPSPGFTEAVMAMLPAPAPWSRTIILRPLLNYIVAACLTIILIELGAFEWTQELAADSGIWTTLLERLTAIIGAVTINLGGM